MTDRPPDADTDDAPLDVLLLLARRWLVLGVLALVGGGAAAAYAWTAPAWYAARLTVVPAQRAPDPMGLASKLPVALDSLSTDVQRIHAVLTSDSVATEVVKRFELLKHYDVEHLAQARQELWTHCAASVDRRSSVVSLTCEDQDPERARAMTAYFGEVGNEVFKRVSSSSAREERRFLQTQVEQARRDVDAASRKLREFQHLHKVVDLPEQSKAVISAMASLKGELVSKQIELSYLASFSSRTESGVVQLQQQIGIMQAKLRQLESSTPVGTGSTATGSAAAGSADFFPDAMAVPALRFELEQLMRDQKIHETVFFLMTERHEMAKVDEARDTSTFQILDHPETPTVRARPRRKKIVAFGLFAGLACGVAWILLPAWWRRRTRASASA